MYKYFAFISYNSKDAEWGKRVQRKLEGYRMPAALCSERGWERKPINPVFFAPTDIQPGRLTAELQERLMASRHLIVICSPNSAKSTWVGKEIEYFHSLGRTENIHFFIVDGVPHSGNKDTECFNPIVDTLGLPEILGANVHEKVSIWPWINKERAYVQLITKLLGVEFDNIWQRHKRLFIEKLCCVILMISFSLFLIYIFLVPFSLTVRIEDEKYNLPISDNAELVINNIHYSLTTLDTIIVQDFTGLWKFKKIHITFNGTYYKNIEKDISPRYVPNHCYSINLKRDSTFAVYAGRVIYGEWQPIVGAKIQIENRQTYTDANGYFFIDFPIQEQSTSKTIKINKKGFKPIVKQVMPSDNIGFILKTE